MPATIEPHELAARLTTGPSAVDLIDVRTPAEYRAAHVESARLHPLDQLDVEALAKTRPAGAQGPPVLLCKAGGRATKAAEKLAACGVEAVVVAGGTDACIAAGLPLKRGKSTISLERQVRIAAGSLVVIGVLLGTFVNPWWLVLPGFVGAGLTFAGITDTCGMGMLLAKMPWNR